MNSANDPVTACRVVLACSTRRESPAIRCDSAGIQLCFDRFLRLAWRRSKMSLLVLRPLAGVRSRRDHVVQMTGDTHDPDFGG
jgi:hypothetical protein